MHEEVVFGTHQLDALGMLTTIIKNKAGRVQLPGSDASLNWREVFRRNEDLLTGVVFGRFRYLSRNALVALMDRLLEGTASSTLGELQSIDLWPRLKGLEGRSFVEPDVLMTFQMGAVLIEVKPPYGGDQHVAQWKAEIQAFAANVLERDEDSTSTLHFVALGRNQRVQAKEALAQLGGDLQRKLSLTIHQREWEDLIEFVSTWQSAGVASDDAVFDDWMQAFDMFGLVSKVSPATMWPSLIAWSGNRVPLLESLASWRPRFHGGKGADAPSAIPSTRRLVEWGTLIEFSTNHPLRRTYESK